MLPPKASTAASQRQSSARTLLYVMAFAVPAAVMAYHIYVYYWLCDDAYISFRYVRNFVDGYGLVFNRGEYVEGYTNFLWVLHLAAALKCLALSPELSATVFTIVYTLGTLLVCLALLRSSPFHGQRVLVLWIVLFLLAINRTFAVWSTSGLETRQFTFFVVLSIWLLSIYKSRACCLWYASLALALAEYSRPEGLLLWGVCVVWYLADSAAGRVLRWRGLLALVLPFAVLVGGHFLFRHMYYGEWLPNTYYTKHVRPWPDAGLTYVLLAGIENGLPVLLPLAIVGLYSRLRSSGDSVHGLALLCIAAHALYLVRIGGDHFEYRPLDFYWPLLTVAAVEGVLHIANFLEALLQRALPAPRAAFRTIAPLVGAAVVALYCTVFQIGRYCLTYELKWGEPNLLVRDGITRDNYPAGFAFPFLAGLVDTYNASLHYCDRRWSAGSQQNFKLSWQAWRSGWAPYEELRGRGIIPPDAVASTYPAGIMPYFLSDLTVIDRYGLTDRHVAHQVVMLPNSARHIAHDKQADQAYLDARGENIAIHPAARTLLDTFVPSSERIRSGAWVDFVLRIRDGLWMPFAVHDRSWAQKAFAGREVWEWRVVRVLGDFEFDDSDDWELSGQAFAVRPADDRQRDYVGERLLSSWDPELGDTATGLAQSPTFFAEENMLLLFRVGGGEGKNVGVALLADGNVIQKWHGQNSAELRVISAHLGDLCGKVLQVQVFDYATDGWGHVYADEFVLVAPRPAFK